MSIGKGVTVLDLDSSEWSDVYSDYGSPGVFLDVFEKNFGILLTHEEKQEFCKWINEQAEKGELDAQSLMNESPEAVSSGLRRIGKEEIHDVIDILIDVYFGACLLE